MTGHKTDMSQVEDDDGVPRQTGWPGLRARLFHLYFLLSRPMTLGTRAVIHDPATNSVFLIRHTYVPGWQLPGGGVEPGETIEAALVRELREEANVEIVGRPKLMSMHLNRSATRRDHVALYLVEAFRQSGPKLPDHEIAEAGFFPVDALPEQTTGATRRRITEVFGDAAPSGFW